MTDVIRDVVVRITLEQINAAIKVPDIAPLKAVEADHAKSIDKVIKKYDEKEETAKLNSKREREYIKDISDAVKEGEKNYAAQLKQRADAEKQVAAAAEAAATKQQVAQLKVLETTKQLGEGVFQLARGIAFLTTSSDEDFREMLATIAKLQGGFDLIKGGATTIKALVEGTNALKIATGAATIGQALLAAANTVVTTTATAATAAVTALKVALGPIGLIITAIGVAAVIGAAAWEMYSKNSESAAKSIDRTTESIRKATKETEIQLKYEQANYDLHKQVTDSRMAQMTTDEQIAALSKERTNLLKLEADLLQKIIEKRKELKAQEAAVEASKNNPKNSGFGIVDILSPVAGIAEMYKDRSDLSKTLKENQDALNDAKQVEINLLNQKQGYLSDELAGQEKVVALENQKHSAAERELERQKQLAEAAKQGLETAKQKLAIEEQKLRSMDAQFGRLTKQEQLEAKALADKVRAGEELNRRQLERLSQIGGNVARDYVEREYAKRGETSGSREYESAFIDPTAGITQTRNEIQSKTAELAEAKASVVTAQREVAEAMQVVNDNKALLETIRNLLQSQGKTINDMQKDLDVNNAQNL